ncbi:Something about silencing protein 10 [Porphyridium purpureum]|uniref:Something about silencing protein 10 n=1 Tax=Porphyridium purpureum TaxID=35688 RepID=A0A5J4YNZ9_PORPP|nr:Something about silencing protein 10 [Porphyridium purpureum]|eukprot:POR7275..scf295_9
MGRVRLNAGQGQAPPHAGGGDEMMDEVDAYMRRRHAGGGGQKNQWESDASSEVEDVPVFDLASPGGASDEERGSSSSSPGESDAEQDVPLKGWGHKKRMYYGGVQDGDFDGSAAREVDDDHDAFLDEEEEAEQLRKQRVVSMRDEDFGIEQAVLPSQSTEPASKQNEEQDGHDSDVLDDEQDGVDVVERDLRMLSKKQRLAIVRNEAPELVRLLADYPEKVAELDSLREALVRGKLQSSLVNRPHTMSSLEFRFHLYSLYCENVALYAAMKASTGLRSTSTISKNHPILNHIIKLRVLINRVEEHRSEIWDILDDEQVEADHEQDDEIRAHSADEADSECADEEYVSDAPDSENQVGSEDNDAQEGEAFLSTLFGSASDGAENRISSKMVQDAEREKQETAAAELNRYLATFQKQQSASKLHANPDQDRVIDETAANKLARAAQKPLSYPIVPRDDNDSSDEEEEAESDAEADLYVQAKERIKRKRHDQEQMEAEKRRAKQVAPKYTYNDEIDPDGQRKASSAILKNRGLTPYRSRRFKNPRLKHRTKFAKAESRAKGYKRTYKGSPGPSYGGESSGVNVRARGSVKIR